jgi:hypothetical protein
MHSTVKKGYVWLDHPGRPFVVFFFVLPAFCLLLLFVAPRPLDRYFLAFPDARTGKYVGEVRYAPRKWSLERKAESVLAEILLGPERLMSLPILNGEPRIRSIMYRSGILYADIGPEFLLEGHPGQDFRASLDSVRRLLKRNLPGARAVTILVNGNLPYAFDEAPPPVGRPEAEKRGGVGEKKTKKR